MLDIPPSENLGVCLERVVEVSLASSTEENEPTRRTKSTSVTNFICSPAFSFWISRVGSWLLSKAIVCGDNPSGGGLPSRPEAFLGAGLCAMVVMSVSL